MTNGTVRIGVIGMGAIGPSHVFAIEHAEGCEPAAVCDVREQAARAAGEKYGVPFFTSVEEMAASGLVDACTVATPSGFHRDAAMAVLRGGKHCLVEKPLEISTDRVDEILEAADSSGAILASVFQSRFAPVARRLRGLIRDGILGEIYSGSAYIKRYRTQDYYDSGGWRGTWKVDGGGCLMNQGIHLVDLYQWFMGDVDQVIAITETKGRNVEVETLALSLVSFAGGAKGVIEGTTLAYPEYSPHIEIFGSRGTVDFTKDKILHMDLLDPSETEKAARDQLMVLTKAQLEKEEQAGSRKKAAAGTAVPSIDMGHTPVVQDFVNAIREGGMPFVDGREARKSVELITAIYESGRKGGAPVRLTH
jgi:UDP-N-acetyl-2-amino-2-deoxyglucuronate dehydrogenase